MRYRVWFSFSFLNGPDCVGWRYTVDVDDFLMIDFGDVMIHVLTRKARQKLLVDEQYSRNSCKTLRVESVESVKKAKLRPCNFSHINVISGGET